MDDLHTVISRRHGHIRLHWLQLIASVLVGLGMWSPAYAQDTTTLTPFQTVEGSLNAGETETWTINALEGQVLSFYVEALSDDLDPMLTLSTSTA